MAGADTAEFPGEVVTRALVRFVDLPLGAGRAALITLDNGHDNTRPNTLGPASLLELDRALDTAYGEPGVVAVCLTGKPFILAAGADLNGVALVTERGQGVEIARLGHRVFARLGDGPVPTFAFVNGLALGGGLELALNCTYRTVHESVAGVALPETFLGLVPGWGGSWLLPNLVGPEKAVTVIVENALNQNRMLRGRQVAELGIADAFLDAADFLEQSLAWAAAIVTGSVAIPRQDFAGATDDEWTAALDRGRIIADMRTHGAAPAPYRALELIELSRRAELEVGFAAEREGLADLVMSQEFRSGGGYAFNLVQKRARRPVGAPDPKLARPVTKVGVIGAGLMAGQIALLFARNLHVPVVMTDVDQARLDKGLASVRRDIDGLKAKKRISADEANRLTELVRGSLDYAAFADAEFVIEAVFEELDVKRQVFAELEKHVSAQAVLATNTSALSVTAMATDLEHPERVVGFHFFTPVAMLPMLEIVKAARTDDATLATAFAVAKGLRKGPVLTADSAGFVVNRLLLRSMGEALAAIDEGTPADVADGALAPLGLPMSPLMLLQLSGPAVAAHVQQRLHAAFGDRFPVSQNLRRIAEAGHRTLLAWDEEGRQVLDPEIVALLVQGDSPSTAEQVRDRVLLALAQEARLILDEGVVADAADLDLGLITGAGWPFWLGGITPYLDRAGYSERATGRRFAPAGVATLPA